MKMSLQKGIIFFLITFSIYCALNLGLTWDEDFLIYMQGKRTAEYLLSLGRIDEDIFRGAYYSPSYYTLKYMLINIFPLQFRVEVSYLINLFFSFLVILGTKKFVELLFNKEVGKIVFLILFFYPAFFGHMAFNSKDTIIALCHIWIFYLLLDYIKKGNLKKNSANNFYLIGLLAAIGSGINMFFLGSMLSVALIVFVEIFFTKIILSKNFYLKIFFKHILKSFLVFYFVLILFWIDTHPDILTLPFKIFYEWVFGGLMRGYPFMLFDGNHYVFTDIPKSYLFENLLFRSPEYFLISYVLFFLIFFSIKFFKNNFKQFNYKITIILIMILNPFIIVFLTPFSIYDGLRHVLWLIPYFCIIPSLVIYYLYKNIDLIKIRFISGIMFFLIIFFLFNFFRLTPYQYTYLNIFSGNNKDHVNKFENDYWGSSISKLIKKFNLNKEEKFIYTVCGLNREAVEIYLKKEGYFNTSMVSYDKADYIIMINRATLKKNTKEYKSKNVTNCYAKHPGKNVIEIKRNNVVLSVLRKIN